MEPKWTVAVVKSDSGDLELKKDEPAEGRASWLLKL
jgi:hypothetical protein